MGKPLTILMPERYRAGHREGLARLRATGESRVIGKMLALHGLRKDGSEFPLELSLAQWKTGEGEFYSGIIRDVTEHRQAEEQVQRHLRQLEALRDVDIAITASLDLRATFRILLDHVTTQLHADAADILLLNLETQLLEYTAGRGFLTDAIARSRLRLGDGYASRAVLDRRVVSIPNLMENQSGNFIRRSSLASESFVAYFVAPLIAKGKVRGVLEIYHRARLDPDPQWLEFLEALAGQAAIALDNATLFERLERSSLELEIAYDATLEGWVHALDLRDKKTEGHTQRVTEMTVRLARQMGLPESDLVHIRRGALLHDIGKIAISDTILQKDGPLTDQEQELVSRHPVYAYEMLSPIAYLRPALEIPYCHHEKWDGTGYPRGLTGEQIPLAARIFAVVDAYDAMVSDRPYREALGLEEALIEMKRNAGTQFDPQVVKYYIHMLQAENSN